VNGGRRPDRLMLDEMFSPQIAQLLARDGVDCVCVADDRLLSGRDDETVLIAAIDQQRVLVTNNVIDFEPLRRNRAALEQSVPPLIYTDDATVPRGRNYIGQLAAALRQAAADQAVGAYGGVLWLSRPH
jgi:predicted nuclease of predicted toxin-antitoxin system